MNCMRPVAVIAAIPILSACDPASGLFLNESNCPIELTSSIQSPHLPAFPWRMKLGPGARTAIMDSPPARYVEIAIKDHTGTERKFSSDDLAKRRPAHSSDDRWAYVNRDLVFVDKPPSADELDRIAKLGCSDLPLER